MRQIEWDDLPEGGNLQREFDRLQRRDWELWSIALLLLTAFAGGIVAYFYWQSTGSGDTGTIPLGVLWQVLFALVALIVLLNAYLIDRKRSLAQLWRRYLLQSQELVLAREEASLDPLTEVFSRRHFDYTVRKEVQRCERTERPLSFLLVGLVDFEQVNKQHGHLVGDQVLKIVAVTLLSTLRATDMVFRYDGDHFMVLLPDTSRHGANQAEERLRGKLATEPQMAGILRQPLAVATARTEYTKDKNLDAVLEEIERALALSAS